MKSLMLASIATLSFAAGMTGSVSAQTSPAHSMQPPGAETPPAPDNVPPPPGADANAGQPTGAVPADPGMAPAPAGVPADATAPVGSSANPVTVGGNATPAPTAAKDYPVCSKTVQDSCIQRSDGKRSKKRR